MTETGAADEDDRRGGLYAGKDEGDESEGTVVYEVPELYDVELFTEAFDDGIPSSV